MHNKTCRMPLPRSGGLTAMKQQNWTWSTKTRKWIPRNMLYNGSFWCSHCGRKISKPEAKTDHKGTPRCPKCHKPLRTKPRMYGKRKPKTSTLPINATPFQTLHEGDGFPPRSAEPTVAEIIIKPAKQQPSRKPCNHIIKSQQKAGGLKK